MAIRCKTRTDDRLGRLLNQQKISSQDTKRPKRLGKLLSTLLRQERQTFWIQNWKQRALILSRPTTMGLTCPSLMPIQQRQTTLRGLHSKRNTWTIKRVLNCKSRTQMGSAKQVASSWQSTGNRRLGMPFTVSVLIYFVDCNVRYSLCIMIITIQAHPLPPFSSYSIR